MGLNPNDVNHSNKNASNSPSQKEDDLFIDLGSIDTRKFLVEEGEKTTQYVNKLSRWEMDSLTALCDTFLPPMEEPPNSTVDESVARFYRTSPSMVGAPEYLGGLISQRLRHNVLLVRLMLILLSTRIGTFVMGGIHSVSPGFPFVRKFSQLPLEKRQRIVRSWATSWFKYFRMAYVGAKLLISISFFTQVDEKGDNPSWKGIGYDGPDPDFKPHKSKQPKSQFSYLTPTTEAPHTNGQNKPNDLIGPEEVYGPLHKGVINVQRTGPKDILAQTLRQSGFDVSFHRSKKQERQTMTIQCDVVVVGSGSGGGVVAGVLASAGYKVLVLEKGDYYARAHLSLLEGPTLDQMYEGAGLLTTRDMGVAILAGATVGGGSAINWAAAVRPPQHVMREWAHVHRLEIFESQLFKEALDKVCGKMEVQNEITKEGFNNAVLRKGCIELGYPVEDIPRNAPPDHECGWCCMGCKDGKKKGVSETWLKDLVDSGNGLILTRCDVSKVLHKKGPTRNVATGVVFNLDGESCIIEAKVTVVSCGALNTPPLLKKSGFKNPNIGKNLHLHPVVMAWGYFPNEHGKSYEGPMMSAMSTIKTNSNNHPTAAIIQTPSLHPGLFAAIMPFTSGHDFKTRMARFSKTAHIFTLARDKGSGTVHSCPDPFDVTYDLDPIDEANLQKGVERMLRILAAAGAEEVGTHRFGGGGRINVKKASYNDFERFVKKESSRAIKPLSTAIASAHQMGSCRMGVDPKESVVDQRGETWEVEGLYLADTSVFPTALGLNPMVTVQAVAYCTAQSVLESLKRKK